MTAPPQMPPITPSFLPSAPATTTFDSNPFMAPFNFTNNAPRRSSSAASANESNGGGNLLFITGNKPADFKKKNVMTKVRKKAMGSYLEKGKKQGVSMQETRSRLHSEDSNSNGSRNSIGSEQDGADVGMAGDEALKMFRGEGRKPRRSTSPIQSPAPSIQDHQAAIEAHIVKAQSSLDSILSSAPIVQPSRNIPLIYDQTSPHPFQSIGKPLDPFRTMFNPNHPRISVEELKFHCSRVFGTKAMGQYWIPTLVKSPHAFLSTLCIASAHLDAINERAIESVQTLALRQEVIHLISQNLLQQKSRVDDFNVIALTQLIASEIIAGNDTTLHFHESGVEAMINARGGLNQLGMKGRLASTLSWVSLESAIIREAKPHSAYSDYCLSTSSKNYPNTATVPESPLYRPRNDFETIKRSRRSSPKTLELLKDIRMMMDLFLHETKHSRQNSQSLKNLYKKITSHYPSIADVQKQGGVLSTRDWTYEAIRLASIIQAEAIMHRIPLSSALQSATKSDTSSQLYTFTNASGSSDSLISPTTFRHDSPSAALSTGSPFSTSPAFTFTPSHSRLSIISTNSSSSDFSYFPPPPASTPTGPTALLQNLKTAIQNAGNSDCWGDMAGVLLWICLVVGAASRKSDVVLKKWFAASAVRCSIMLCFEHPEPIHATLLRMGEVVEALDLGASGVEEVQTGMGRKESVGKRRRM